MEDKEVYFGILVDGNYLWFSWMTGLLDADIYPENDDSFDFYIKRIMNLKSCDFESQSGYLDNLPKNVELAASFHDIISVQMALEEMDIEVLNKYGYKPTIEDIFG